MAEEGKEKKVDVLDEIQMVEKVTKRILLIKQLAKLKKLERQRIENAKKCELLLEQIGLKKEDVKKVIGFVSKLPELELTDEEIKELRQDIKDEVKEEKESATDKIQKQMEEKLWSPTFVGNLYQPVEERASSSWVANTITSNTAEAKGVRLYSSDGQELSVDM